MLFRTVPSANTLVRRVNENAFASVVQARPCPAFGRPVHLRGLPHRLQPATSPHTLRFHLAMDTLSSGGPQVGGFRSALACFRLSLSCPVRLLHTLHLLRPARHYPRVRIWRSSFERQRDFNPPEQRAAQRTLRTPRTPSRLRKTSFWLPGRVSPVPPCSVQTCHRLRPRGGPAFHPVFQNAVCCLRRDMSGSALPNTFRLII